MLAMFRRGLRELWNILRRLLEEYISLDSSYCAEADYGRLLTFCENKIILLHKICEGILVEIMDV